MSVETHRAALVAAVSAVADAGHVHPHEVYLRGQAELQDKYLWTDDSGRVQLRGWFLRRVRTTEAELAVGRTVNTHRWELRGFMALDSDAASELAFDALIEAIRKTYRDDPTFGGEVELGPLEQPTGWQLSDSRPVMFTNVLCHAAVLAIDTHEYLNTPGE